ncbi:MAG TPA: rhomboid family intramembrane serine protease [Candidatus Limnocylindrales bacterium]|nr:rhomboid family intramembrane serine protease [Candidatus Limnocylindrales bacterium]
MIPLRDRNPTRSTPVVTFGLIAACFIVFALELWISFDGGDRALERFLDEWGAVPSKISAAIGQGDYLSPPLLGILTSLFLHGGWLHILGNMLFLWIFGNNVEDRLGRIPFLVFYVLGGLAAGLSQVWIAPDSSVPLVGASGAIAAVLGLYFVLWPGARITSLVFLGFFYQLAEVPALIVLGYWFVLQLLSGVTSLGAATAESGVAFFAHIGGFVVGMAVGLVVRATGIGGSAVSRPYV